MAQSGAVALVTGATAGFGEAIARRLVHEGFRVIATGRRVERLHALHEDLGEALLPFALDVTDAPAVAALPSSLPEGWREIEVLVNNAGLALGLDPAHKADLVDWDKMVATNVTGLIHVTRALLPGMVERDRGTILNGATKAFVLQFSLNLKADLVGTGVRVTNIEPGMVGGTEFSSVRFHGDGDKAAKVYEGANPLTAEDIAEAVSWIVKLPPHMNVNRIELMPTCQGPGPFVIKRT
jgi:3-hydroxy acid dehydrogenase/malonic semialdehyde reductase